MSTEPILSGFYPDPSICRVGEEYFLANSTFEYVPGVPIHRSRDLVTWELVGHALPDAAVINAPEGVKGASAGIFAPTLRHHDGLFWLVTTSIGDPTSQLITHAVEPEGPWSQPVYVRDAAGIDPDLAWDEDGVCLLTWRGFEPGGIHQVAIDPLTGEKRGENAFIWEGTGLADTEGPHLYRRGGWWYLVVAEGGTHRGHAVTVARSRSPRGPFEENPANPILSHRSLEHPVQATGHADLVERPDGTWALVHLAIRQAGAFPLFHVNGRETFLAGVDWVDDWPVVVEDRFAVPPRDLAWEDRFDAPALAPRWLAPSVAPASFSRTGDGLTLAAGRDAAASEQRAVLCVRATDRSWDATATVAQGSACLSVRIDAAHWYGVELVDGVARARAVSAPFDQVMGETAALPGDALAIRVRGREPRLGDTSGPDVVSLGLVRDGAFVPIADLDGRYVSTEVAGGFTGRMIGLEALDGDATVTVAAYTPVASG